MPRKMRRDGRSTGTMARFVALEHYLLNSQAWAALCPAEVAAYVAIAQLYNGSNNGRLAVSTRLLGARMKASKNTAAKAIHTLIAHGFIERVKSAHFSVKVRHAAEFRLTAYPCNVTRALASKAFLNWQPENQKSVTPQIQAGPATDTDKPKAAGNLSQKKRSGISRRTGTDD